MSSNLLLKLGVTSHDAGLEIYRDGEVVTLVAKAEAVRENGGGKVKTSGVVVQQYESIKAYEEDRQKLFDRFPLAYTKIVNKLGISDDVRKALPLPEHMRNLLPEYSKALPSKAGVNVAVSGEISTDHDGNDEVVNPDWYKKFMGNR